MTPFRAIAGWGVLMAVVGVVGAVAFGFPDVETPALFAGVALTMVVLAVLLHLLRLDRRHQPELAAAADISPATAWLAISCVLLGASAELGLWLTLIAGGMAAAGVGGVIRELRAERQATRGAARPDAVQRAGHHESVRRSARPEAP